MDIPMVPIIVPEKREFRDVFAPGFPFGSFGEVVRYAERINAFALCGILGIKGKHPTPSTKLPACTQIGIHPCPEDPASPKKKNQKMMMYNGFKVRADCETEVLHWKCINIHPRDLHVAFCDAEHKYYIDGKQAEISVTGIVHHGNFRDFDPEERAKTTASGKNFLEKGRLMDEILTFGEDVGFVEMIEVSWKERDILGAQLACGLGLPGSTARLIPQTVSAHKLKLLGSAVAEHVAAAWERYKATWWHKRLTVKMAECFVTEKKFWEEVKKAAGYGRLMVSSDGSPVPVPEMALRLRSAWEANGELQSGKGTRMHRFIELVENCAPQEDHLLFETCVERAYYMQYAFERRRGGYVTFRTEMIVHDAELNAVGMVDMLDRHAERGTFHLIDWKRSREIRWQGFGQGADAMGIGLCSHLPDSNFYHYSIQLNIYKFLLEKNYGIEIEDMHIVVFHPNNDGPVMHKIGDYQELAEKILRKKRQIKPMDLYLATGSLDPMQHRK